MDKVAVIVETRKYEALPFVLNNVMTQLPDDWLLQIFHGLSNVEYIEHIIEKDNFLSNIVDLNVDGKSQNVLPREIKYDVISDEPIHVDFCGLLGRFLAEDAFRNHFGTKKAQKWTPGTLKIKVFTWKVFKIQGLGVFDKEPPKCPHWSSQELPKWRSKSPWGRLKTVKNGPRTFQEATRPEPVNFFSPPEASRSAPGSIFIAFWRPPGAQGEPRGPGGLTRPVFS